MSITEARDAERDATEGAPPPLPSDAALFLDFDGTLAPIQDDPDAVRLPEGGAATLERLADALGGALALVSGRDARDLTARVPSSLWRAGNHGGMVLEPGRTEPDAVPSAPPALREAAERAARAHGAWVEEKAAVLALHTRANPDAEPAILAALRDVLTEGHDYKLQHGKRIIELKPRGMDKGVIIARLCEAPPFAGRVPVFLGDDTTDEDGFAVAARLGGFAVKVGDGATAARYRLGGPDGVWSWLERADGLTGTGGRR